MITERRFTGFEELRGLAIKEDWFTYATNEEYKEYLDYCHKNNLTTEDIMEMAQLVLKYSDTDMELTSVMFEIADVCYTVFDER